MAKFKIDATFHLIDKVALAGKVESGVITPGMKIDLEGNIFEVKNIEAHHQEVPQANTGDAVGLALAALQVQEEYMKKSFVDTLLGSHKDPNFKIFEKYQNTTIDVL
jgi:translation elongation factor EF-1alpha